MQGRLMTLLVAGLAALAVGCTATVNPDTVEQGIRDELLPQLGVEFTDVECPGGQAVQEGATFNCTATKASGGDVDIRVTQTDAEGSFDMVLTTIIAERVEALIRSQLEAQVGSAVEVDCGDDRPMETGGTLECTASADGVGEVTILVTQTDDTGNIEWEITSGP